MWRLLVLFLARLAWAVPASHNGTVTCPHDALYTSLTQNGTEFCSRVLEAARCGGEYRTPVPFIPFNQTRISSYCQCILTPNATATTTGSWNVTIGEATATTRGTASMTVGSDPTKTRHGRPGSRPGPSISSKTQSGNSASTASGSGSGRGGVETNSPFSASSTVVISGGSANGTTLASAAAVSATNTTTDPSHHGSTQSAGALSSISGVTTEDVASGISSKLTASGIALPTTGNTTNIPSGPSGTGHTWLGSHNATTASLAGTGTGSVPLTTGGASAPSLSGWNSSWVSITGSVTTFGAGTGGGTLTGIPLPSGNFSGTYTYTNGTIASGTGTGVTATGGSQTLTLSRSVILATGSSTRSGITRGPTGTNVPGSGHNNTSLVPEGSLPANITATPTYTKISATGYPNATTSAIGNATSTGGDEIPAANFTRVTRTAAISQPTCYQLHEDPTNDPTRRALLHNTYLREQNATIPYPYIESVDFKNGGIDPLYLTVRDIDDGTHYIDISNSSQIAIVDESGNSMLLDEYGIHFTTNSCHYSVDITIKDMYQQLAALAGVECAASGPEKRMEDMGFLQVVNLHDQCGNPVTQSLRPYPMLYVGDTPCTTTNVSGVTGQWVFDCTFPGSRSGSMECEWAIQNDVVDFLLTDPFGGACPDLSTVITTLEATAKDILSPDSLLAELYNQGLDPMGKDEANTAVTAYEQLWDILQQCLSKTRVSPPTNTSALENYINVYNAYRDFDDDICEDLHAGEIPLPLTLTAGASSLLITTLNWAPETSRAFNLTIQDSSQIACCGPASVASDSSDGTCSYPSSALIPNSDCVCGRTVRGRGLAFEYGECENYVSTCDSDVDCKLAGYSTYVCLTGSCCGVGVCVDPYACSQNGTALVKV